MRSQEISPSLLAKDTTATAILSARAAAAKIMFALIRGLALEDAIIIMSATSLGAQYLTAGSAALVTAGRNCFLMEPPVHLTTGVKPENARTISASFQHNALQDAHIRGSALTRARG